MTSNNKPEGEYDPRFDEIERMLLQNAKVPPSVANRYRGFGASNINYLVSQKIPPETAERYLQIYGEDALIHFTQLFLAGITPEEAAKYPKGFSYKDIYVLERAGIPKDLWEAYEERFHGSIVELMQAKVTSLRANRFDKRFYAPDVINITKKGIRPEDANMYNQRFSGSEVARLIETSTPYLKAEAFPKELNGYSIATLSSIGVNPVTTLNGQMKELSDILNHLDIMKGMEKNPENYSFIALGSEGIIVRSKNERRAIKISENATKEYGLQVLTTTKTTLENVVNFTGILYTGDEPTEDIRKKTERLATTKNARKIFEEKLGLEATQGLQAYFEYTIDKETKDIENLKKKSKIQAIAMEYIEGNSIDKIIESGINISERKILKYGGDIMNGLMSLRRGGILYHRDIRPGNIIIEDYTDKAIILDLSYATTDASEYNRLSGNRRFNGPNDLSSLGQLMYYMATGTSVFAETKEHKSDMSDIADEIQKNRSKIYKDKTAKKMNEIYAKIDANISDKKLSYMIKECLTAKHTDYERISRLFPKVNT